MCRKRGQEEKSSYNILCQSPTLARQRTGSSALARHRTGSSDMARHRTEIFSSAWLQPIENWRASIRIVLALNITDMDSAVV
jgi:hypothetical protein